MAHLRQRSHCTPRKPRGWDRGGDDSLTTWGEYTHQAPGHLSGSDLGRARNTGPTESVSLWSIREPEHEWLRPGKCTQPMARFGQFPYRATWSLSSVNRESTHAMKGGKTSGAHTLQALPTHTSDICLQCFSLPIAQLNSKPK